MTALQWNDGLTVGIKAIDDDHKALLKLINQLFDAVSAEASHEDLAALCEQLGDYVSFHFAREEAFMRKCGYNDDSHLAEHRAFAEKIPALTTKLLAAETPAAAQEIGLYLFDWLVEHIIGRDMEMAQLVRAHGYGDANQATRPGWRRLVQWLNVRMALGVRVLTAPVTPLIGIVLLAAVIIGHSYDASQTAKRLVLLSDNVGQINALTHSLQLERGLSSGYLSSQGQDFAADLEQRRQHTDGQVVRYLEKVETTTPRAGTGDGAGLLRQTINQLDERHDLRRRVDALALTVGDSIQEYTKTVDLLFSLAEEAQDLNVDPDLGASISALIAVLRLKEAAGLERAEGVAAINHGAFTQDAHLRFVELIETQKAQFKIFLDKADTAQKTVWRELLSDDIEARVRALEHQGRISPWAGGLAEMDGQEWFATLTKKIERLKLIADHLAAGIKKNAAQAVDDAVLSLYLVTGFLLVMIVATALASLFLSSSILVPIRMFTKRIVALGKGDLTQRFHEDLPQDEFGAMAVAFEQCRRGLLREHYLSELQFQRKDIEVQVHSRRSSHFEHMAFTDPLTGATNRRGIEKMAETELARSARHNHPITVMMLDLDHFKAVNDTYGHAAGDDVLVAFCDICRASARNEDVVARLGGEEFCLLLPETDEQAAVHVAERLLQAIREAVVKTEGATITFTASIGIAERRGDEDLEQMLGNADAALYEAKENGRDRAEVYRAPE